jgi:hypothetical protein
MLKANEWAFYIRDDEESMMANGVYALSITDAVLDPEDWPVWCVVVREGFVAQQHTMYEGRSYKIPAMVGCSVHEIAAWVRGATGTDAEQVSHNIMPMV